MKAIGYVRVSTEEQARGVSLDAQADRIRAYCAMTGLDLVDLIRDEGVSTGKRLERRPGGQQVAAALASGAVHVVALKLDRLFRNALEALLAAERWDKRGVTLHLVDQSGASISSRGAMGKFFFTMLAAIAEMERNQIRERTSAALQFKKANGERVGTIPFGYQLAGDGVHLEENEGEQEILRLIAELRGRSLTLRAISEELNRRGYRTRRGKRWTLRGVHHHLKAA